MVAVNMVELQDIFTQELLCRIQGTPPPLVYVDL